MHSNETTGSPTTSVLKTDYISVWDLSLLRTEVKIVIEHRNVHFDTKRIILNNKNETIKIEQKRKTEKMFAEFRALAALCIVTQFSNGLIPTTATNESSHLPAGRMSQTGTREGRCKLWRCALAKS